MPNRSGGDEVPAAIAVRSDNRDAVMNTTDAAGLRSLRETFDRAAAMIASA
jgi:hypothetical protein